MWDGCVRGEFRPPPGRGPGYGFGWDYLPIWGCTAFRAVGGMKEEENGESHGRPTDQGNVRLG